MNMNILHQHRRDWLGVETRGAHAMGTGPYSVLTCDKAVMEAARAYCLPRGRTLRDFTNEAVAGFLARQAPLRRGRPTKRPHAAFRLG